MTRTKQEKTRTATTLQKQQQHYRNVNEMTNEIASRQQHYRNDNNKTRTTTTLQKQQQENKKNYNITEMST